jgi:peptidoglycan/xylan/chitin deacetylase (PgdA/CDA1 family)
MLLKTAVKRALHSTGVSSSLARRDGASFILAAHIVLEEEAEQLADVIRLLQQSFSLVSIDEYLDALRAGRCRNLVTLTFDDGLRNQLTVTHGVLASLRVPATFYVCPALVGTPFSTWTWELAPRLSRLSRRRQQEIFARAAADSFEPFLQRLKEMPLGYRDAIWAEIVDATPDFSFTPDEERCFGLMDWAELAKLDQSLITIGSHTHTHVDLPRSTTRAWRAAGREQGHACRRRLGYDARHCLPLTAATTIGRRPPSPGTSTPASRWEPRAVGSDSRPHRLPRIHLQWGAHELALTPGESRT